MSNQLFWQQFKQNFFHTGAVLPSSQAVAKAITAYLSQKQGRVNVLEAGPGSGAFTAEIVSRLQPDDALDLVEINPLFVSVLQRRLQTEALFQAHRDQITLINADLRHLPLTRKYDYILSSLPFANFPPDLMEEVLRVIMDHLKPGGIFSFVNYIFFGRLKFFVGGSTWLNYRQNRTIIKQYAQEYQFARRVVVANIPPTWVLYWQKPPR